MKENTPLTSEQQVLVEQNLDLVRSCVLRCIDLDESVCGMGYDDLYQEGCVALCHAAASYDSQAGAKFSTYASAVIRNHLLDHCRYLQAKRRSAPVISLDSYDEDGVSREHLAACDDSDNQLNRLCLAQLLEHGRRAYHGTAQLGIEALELKARGYTGADIAQLYGVRPNLVGAWISRATAKLKSDFILSLAPE